MLFSQYRIYAVLKLIAYGIKSCFFCFGIGTPCFVIICVEIRGSSSCNMKRFIAIWEIVTQWQHSKRVELVHWICALPRPCNTPFEGKVFKVSFVKSLVHMTNALLMRTSDNSLPSIFIMWNQGDLYTWK